MALGLFIGFRSDTLGALEQVLSAVFAGGLMGICLGTPPEPWGGSQLSRHLNEKSVVSLEAEFVVI